MARCGGGSFGSHNYSHARELGSGPLRRGRSRRESARPGSLLFPVPVSRELIGKHGENQRELRCLACEPMSVVGSIWEESLLFSLFAGISTRELAGGTRNRTGDRFAPDCPHRQFHPAQYHAHVDQGRCFTRCVSILACWLSRERRPTLRAQVWAVRKDRHLMAASNEQTWGGADYRRGNGRF